METPAPCPGVAQSEAGRTQVNSARSPLSSPKPGLRTTQFWLLAGVLALAAWMVFAGKLDAGWFAALAPVAALVYQAVRENLYRDAATHPDAALDRILQTVMDRITPEQTQHVPAILAALKGPLPGGVGVAEPALSGVEGPAAQREQKAVDTTASTTPASLALLGAMLLSLPGCAQTPYYVSGINGTVDASKDGSHIAGGEVGVTISPNPNYPLPAGKGFAK